MAAGWRQAAADTLSSHQQLHHLRDRFARAAAAAARPLGPPGWPEPIVAQELADFAPNLPNECSFSLSPAHGAGISRQMQRPGGSARVLPLRLRSVAVSREVWLLEQVKRLYLGSGCFSNVLQIIFTDIS